MIFAFLEMRVWWAAELFKREGMCFHSTRMLLCDGLETKDVS